MRARPINIYRGKIIIILLALFACNILSYGQNASKIYDKAKDLIGKKKYEEVITLLEKNIELFEKEGYSYSSSLFLTLGESYSELKNYEKAIIYYLKVDQAHKSRLEYYNSLMLKANNEENKSLYIRSSNNTERDISENLYTLSQIYFYLSDYKEAVTTLEKSIEIMERMLSTMQYIQSSIEKKLTDRYFRIAWYYLYSKDFSSVEKASKRALEINSNKTWIKVYEAHSLLFQRKTADAEKIYFDLAQTSIEEDNNNVQVLLNEFDELEKEGLVSQNVRNDFERIKTDIIALKNVVYLNNVRLSDNSDITVTFTNDTLIISGNGEMEDFLYKRSPWHDRRGKINHIIIKEGVLSIGAYAFEEMGNLQSIILPETITKIGEGAFDYCNKIKEIRIPDNVKTIEQFAFRNCQNIRSITIPEGVTSIENGTFDNCKLLEFINLPNSIKNIGMFSFAHCTFTTFKISENVASIGEGAFMFCPNLSKITIPSRVTSIGEDAFNSSGLKSISVDDTNTRYYSINDRALCSNDTLLFVLGEKDFRIPENITTIGSKAFYTISEFEGYNKISSVSIPNSVKNIGDKAFKGCVNITTIKLPPELETINNSAFSGCKNLNSIIIPENIKKIGDFVFENTGIKSIVFQNRDIHIGKGCFSGCDNLNSIIFDERAKYTFRDGLLCINDTLIFCIRIKTGSVIIPQNIRYIEEKAFQGCEKIKSISIPDGVTHINNYAFADCSNLTSVIIPNSVIYLGESAFENDASLASVTLSDNLLNIELRTFENCQNLSSVILPGNLKTIGEYAFSNTNLISVVFPNSLNKVLREAFYSCKKLSSITIPDKLIIIESGAFDECPELKTVVNLSSVPQNITQNAFGYDPEYLIKKSLFVPESSVLSYQNTIAWERFNVQPLWKNSEELSSSIIETEEIIKQAKTLHGQRANGEAISLLLQNKAIFEKSKNLSSFYGHLSWYYIFEKDFKNAEEAANMGLSIDNSQTWININLAHALMLQGQSESVNKLYHSLSTTPFLKRQSHSNNIFEQLTEIKNAGLLNNEQLAHVEKIRAELLILIDTEKKVAMSRNLFSFGINDFKGAIDLLIPIQNRFSEKNPFSAETMTLLGAIYYSFAWQIGTGKVSENLFKSESYFLQAKSILENTEKKHTKEYLTILYFLGALYLDYYFDNKDFDKSIEYYLKAKDISEHLCGNEDNLELFMTEDDIYPKSMFYRYMYGSNLNRFVPGTSISKLLGYLYNLNGYDERLLALYLNELNFVNKNSVDYKNLLRYIALTYYRLGDYFNVEKSYIELIDIEKSMGIQNESYAINLMTVGEFFTDIGDYEKAEEYLSYSKNIFITNKGQNYYPGIFSNLADLYNRQKRVKEAQEIYNEAEPYFLSVYNFTKEKSRFHPNNYASSLTLLGSLYYYMNEHKKTESYFLKAKEVIEKTTGKEHSYYTSILRNLGDTYSKTGDYAKAEKNYLESIAIREKTNSKEHPDYTKTMNNLSHLYQKNNDFGKASKIEQDICSQTVEHIIKNFSFLSEYQRNSYWATVEDIFENSYSLSFHHPEEATNELNFNNTLFTKGLLLRTNNQIRDAIYDFGDETLIQQFEQLGVLRKQINVFQNADSLDVNYVKSLTTRADSLDKALTQASAKFRDIKEDMAMAWQDVQKQLTSNEAAIEFVHFRLYDKEWTDTTIYAAMVLRPGMESPVWIPLCDQNELHSVLSTNSENTEAQTQTIYSYRGNELYQLIWGKIEKELPDVKTIYYSPSGLFHKIAINALPTDNESVLLLDKYDLHLVSSTREIKRIKKNITSITIQDTTTVYGGLLYDSLQAEQLAEAKLEQSVYAKPEQESSSDHKERIDKFRKPSNQRQLPKVDLREAFSKWPYLNGSKIETEKIVKLLDNKQIPYKTYFGIMGNEESFKNLSGTKADVIHLSTHGFFLSDVERKDAEDVILQLGGNKAKPYENSLLRSGLIMTGANEHWLNKESIVEDDKEDGVLTADEISHLNLIKTKLVVLSACETGLGDVKNSEGVFGLQRAFKLAGVESLIMSLWQVPDEQTSELMSTFYDEWLGGKSRHESFKIAQQKVRQKYLLPYYWAAFVMMD